MRMLGFLLFFLGLSSCLREPAALAGTFTAATCNVADVNAVINGPTHTAADGDIIIIPAGSCTWVTGIVVPSGIGITLTGVGNPTSDPAVIGADPSCSQTVIIFAPTVTTRHIVEAPAFGNSTSRISCMAINYGSGPAVAINILGTCTTSGCPSLRWDNLTFNNWGGHAITNIASYGITLLGDIFGVIDHNAILGTAGNAGTYLHLTELSNGSFLTPSTGPGATGNGDNSWAQPAGFGSANFLFIENNHFLNAGTMDNEGSAGPVGIGTVNEGGARTVVRYNKWDGLNQIQSAIAWHGTETGGRARSGRAWEFYGNTYNCDIPSGACAGPGGMRGGTGYSWGNTLIELFTGRLNGFWTLATYRAVANIVWGVCDGSSVYDTNDGVTYFSGTIASVTTGRNPTITVSGTSPGWTTNQWGPVGINLGAPYSVHDLTQNSGNGTGSEILSSGANTLQISVGSGAPGDWTPAVNDSIQITRATVCIDQAGGRGAGFLYTGNSSVNAGSPLVPANQAVEPSYFWMNTSSVGVPQHNVSTNTARVVGGRDYYTESLNQAAQSTPTSPFSGTSTLGADGGVGHGTLANRPPTCTINTAYWATDQGNWNHAPGGTQGQLYICTATTPPWTLSYTPYTYPHPLTQVASPAAGGYTGILSGIFH